MNKVLKVKVPEILKERGLEYVDLHFGARIARATAERWADPELAKGITRADFDTLVAIASFLNVGIDGLLEIVDDE